MAPAGRLLPDQTIRKVVPQTAAVAAKKKKIFEDGGDNGEDRSPIWLREVSKKRDAPRTRVETTSQATNRRPTVDRVAKWLRCEGLTSQVAVDKESRGRQRIGIP